MEEIAIKIGKVELKGDLAVPDAPHGLVIFAHGSGSSRLSSRNRAVAAELNRAGFATLLFDLLTEEEDETYANRFDIQLLTRRLVTVTKWATEKLPDVPLGYFGASTGAAAALFAAAELKDAIQAVVSRGGRPDLALDGLPKVTAPTLLIVGGDDTEVIELNRLALAQLRCTKDISIVPGATHLFEEPGALEQVSELAKSWFARHLAHDIRT